MCEISSWYAAASVVLSCWLAQRSDPSTYCPHTKWTQERNESLAYNISILYKSLDMSIRTEGVFIVSCANVKFIW